MFFYNNGSSRCLAQTTLITLGVQVYEILRPKFPHVVQILQQIPNANVADIQKLDEKIAQNGGSKGNKIDKAKKDLFKKLTAPVSRFEWAHCRMIANETHPPRQLIGKTLGQLFRKEVQIINLPPMFTRNPNNFSNSIVDSNQPVGMAQLFSTDTWSSV